MEDMKSLLTVTLVVMAAGSSIYTIKTFMKPGMDLNINLEENHSHHSLAEALATSNRTFPVMFELPTTTQMPIFDIEINTIAEPIEAINKSEPNPDRKRSLPSKSKLHLNEIVEKIKKMEKKPEVEEEKVEATSAPTAVKQEEPEIETDATATTMLGKIQGSELTVLGRRVNAFLGVPYAQPPVGALRFARPLPVTSWNETIDAKKFGNACIQAHEKNTTRSSTTFSEDCLNLNIWTPARRRGALPVMFFVHGGNFVSGSNSGEETDGRVLAALENVIVVAPNYRLGPMGFFALDGTVQPALSDEATNSSSASTSSKRDGNYGLWDLVEALKWTLANIGAFGGSPDSITLVGHSSGALASALLLTSPESTHLASRAILQSGSSTVFNFYYQQSQRASEEFATLLGCMKATEQITPENLKMIANCVRSKSNEEILAASEKQLSQKMFSYSPRIGDELLPQRPQELLEKMIKSQAGTKQLLIGANSHDVPFFFKMGYPQLFTKKSPTLKDLEEVRQFLASSLKDWGISRRTLRLINSFFLEKSSTLEPRTLLKAMYDIFGDLTFSCPTLFFAERFTASSASAGSNHSAYFYHFNRNSSNNEENNDETPFVFGHPLLFAHKYSGSDIDLSKRLMTLWANFARTGQPGKLQSLSSTGSEEWPKFTGEKQSFLEFSGFSTIGEHGIGRVGQHASANITQAHSSTGSASGSSTTSQQRLNCDTWKHAFKIFT